MHCRRETGMMYFLFDMDGVLVDSREAWYRSFRELGDISREEFENEYWGRDLEKNISDLGTTRQRLCGEVFPSHSGSIRKVEGAEEVLESLDGPKALITNTTGGCTSEILSSHGLEGYFDRIVTSDQVDEGKPDPSMVRKALDLLGAEPGRSVVIGDSPHDMEAGSKAGCITIGIGVDGDYRADTLRDVPGLVEEIRKSF